MNTSKVNEMTSSYQELLLDSLKDKEETALYLQAALDEFNEDANTEVLLVALRNVLQAQGKRA